MADVKKVWIAIVGTLIFPLDVTGIIFQLCG